MPSRTPLQKLRKIGDQDLCSKKSDLRVSVDHKLTRTGYEKGRATPPLRGQLGEAHRLTGCGQRPPHERPDTAEREYALETKARSLARSLAGTQGPFKLSVRTAWEIAALEDVRLAPSPRQQQPAPAPCVRPASASPLPGPAEDPGAADREVLTRGWGRFPSALGCSVAYRPSPPPPCGT
ncbi:disabled homolog 2-interacting protein isoform X1 [Physeter macrocephalus]|uniref:Disabled homolog 2-interacting protein isoform X1 n=1 Tax=Physeter macrocephalus TaxID=9755 RepID=A0A9W2WUT5_PHYMC|nr:disabled homolog 2-interacting protein isoform X1 [Physeter catodon]